MLRTAPIDTRHARCESEARGDAGLAPLNTDFQPKIPVEVGRVLVLREIVVCHVYIMNGYDRYKATNVHDIYRERQRQTDREHHNIAYVYV